ncbi:MAG: GNAT family N-acetyltransferase [Ignavibacteria bacterium]
MLRTIPSDKDFLQLVLELDNVLRIMDGEDHEFYAQFNIPDDLQSAVVAYVDDTLAGCGAIKKYSEDTAEIKRMYVRPLYRRNGIAKSILKELENWSNELQHSQCILETAKKLTNAVGLYQNSGYKIIPNYGQYIGVEFSLCMKKEIF